MQTSYASTAQFYDRIYSVMNFDDQDFYLELAAKTGGPVLELGAGTGRISIPLARAGYEVTALDLNQIMLDEMRAKLSAEDAAVSARIETQLGDMSSFELGREYKLIIMPFRGFQHLLSPAEQRSCLERVARHLAPGGRFVFDAFCPNFDFLAKQAAILGALRPEIEHRDEQTGQTLRRYVSVLPRYYEQINEVLFRYELTAADGSVTHSSADRIYMRWQTRWECEYLLELCGLKIEAGYGGFDRRSLDDAPRELVYVCSRAA
jgi:ubiquinone/menaquinone biosynthesis C-methylase UbiE